MQKNVATFMLVISFVTGGLSAFVAPKFGHMSDRYGRCRLLALVSCGGLLAELITILTAKFPQTVDYRWLFLGAVFDGMTGSFTAGNILSQSYTSDCTPPSKRAVSIGYVQACLFVGLALGPLLAGYFVKWTGSLVSIFYVSLVCHAFFALFVGFLIPESLSAKKQLAARDKWQKEKEARAMHMGSWLSAVLNWNPLAPLKILWPTGPGTSTRLRVNLMALAISDAILLGAALAVGPVLMLYAEFMFQWGNLEASRFVSFLSMARVVVLMCIFPLINHFGRVRPAARRRKLLGAATVESNSGADRLDLWVLRFALFWDVLGTLGYALSWNEALFVGSGFITALGGPGSATAQAVATQHVPPERVGQILGAIGMLHALSRVVGPIVFNGIYAATVATYPKAVILALCGLFVIALVCSFIVRPHGESSAGAAQGRRKHADRNRRSVLGRLLGRGRGAAACGAAGHRRRCRAVAGRRGLSPRPMRGASVASPLWNVVISLEAQEAARLRRWTDDVCLLRPALVSGREPFEVRCALDHCSSERLKTLPNCAAWWRTTWVRVAGAA